MKKLTIFYSISLIIFFCISFSAQIPGLINYSEENGLNSSYTYRLSQDSNGFIWVGSDNGLFRFDGKEFKQYSKKNGLKNIDVLACYPLSNGEIFINPFLNDFAYLKNGKIINSDTNKELRKIQFGHNPDIHINKDSLIIYTTYNPKSIYIYKNGKVTIIPLFIGNNPNIVYYAFGFDQSKNLLYLSDQQSKITAYDIVSKKITPCNISSKKGTAISRKGDYFIFRFKRTIEIYKRENNFHFKKLQSYTINENIHQMIVDKNFKIWLCLEKGGSLYFKESLLELEKIKISAPTRILDNYIINDIMMDKDNNAWFSTRNNGIFFIADRFFKNYIHLPIKNNSGYITAITKNDKNIILGYNEAKSGIFNSKKIENITLEKDRKIEHKAIFAKGNTIIFGLSLSLIQYNTATGKKDILCECNIKNIIPFTENSVLLCTSDALTTYNYINKTFTEILKERVYNALPYDKDSIFVGSFKDLYKLNIKTKKKRLFLEGYYFTDIKKLRPNVYLGSTNLNGIILFNNKGIIRKITEKDGLTTSQIKKIEVENGNTFWASTNSGLCRVEIQSNKLKINNFTQTDGLPSNVIAGCVIKNDTIYAGTSKGLGVLPIKSLFTQQKFINKKVIINSVTIGNKEFLDLNHQFIGQSPNNDIIFNLSFPDYSSQGKIKYKYKIDGLNENWQTSNSSTITFNAIPPGKYVFKVFGLGYNGKQSQVSSDLSFEIKPQFWQTWWFKFLLIIASAALLFTLITFYFQKKRNKKLETLYYEKKIAELELQAIKAQINPHFIYNCLNSIQFLLYKKDYPETENYLDIFSQMIRKTLHYSEKTFMPIKEEVEYLSLYLNMEKLRLKDQFEYKISVSEKVNENWTIPSLLIQPFAENAIKHGIANLNKRKGIIEISFDHIDSSLCITIEDNGAGITNKSESIAKTNSFGVKLSQKRIETFKQLFETNIELEINNLSDTQQKSGTQIKLYIKPYENQNTSLHH
ncbi:histidine kinase [Chryseobacterium sp. SIMBA_038]|uniref:sensor histidine kinase n=2 Tax=Pseudomonadati TaxID=3379134 RepID=UPI00397D2565